MTLSPSASRPRVALVHAVQVAMQPVEAAFLLYWPEAEVVHLLDDSLSPDRARSAGLTTEMHARINSLANYAVAIRSNAILYTCSAFGEAIEAAAGRLALPVLKPNESMFEEALNAGGRIGMLATFGPSVMSMEQEFRELAGARGRRASIQTVLVADAMTALKSGDEALHNRLLAEASWQLQDCDCIMLAHFSTSRALNDVQARVACKVLTSPGSAVVKLRSLVAA